MNSEIKFNVILDENKMPEKITWLASDSGIPNESECKSFLLSIWDKKNPGTLRIDLWTKDMMVDEMQHFFYQSLVTMADTYARATNDKANADELRKFADSFARKTGSK